MVFLKQEKEVLIRKVKDGDGNYQMVKS